MYFPFARSLLARTASGRCRAQGRRSGEGNGLRSRAVAWTALAMAAAGPLFAQAPTRAATAAALARAGDAVVTFVVHRDGTTEVTSGTGVRVADGRVLTALRQLRGASRIEVFGASGDLLSNVSTLDQADVKLDLAVLPRSEVPGNRVVLARRSATLGQKVSLLGPRTGTARPVSERTVSHVEPDDAGRPLLRLGASITGASIGAPVVNARGEIVALALGSIPGRDEGDIAVDVSALREVLARPGARLGLPARDGTIAAARAAVDPRTADPTAAPVARSADPATRPRASIFPERYGAPISADTAGAYAVELFGCARLESRQKVYCYLRVTNLGKGATFGVNGGDLADSTRRKLRAADNLLIGETVQRVAGWRKKAAVPLRELEAARVALEFGLPERDGDAVRLMIDVAGERTLWLGPFVLQRAP